MSQDLTELRGKIDSIDAQLVDLFKERMNVSRDIAAYKKAHSMPTLDAGRERSCWPKWGNRPARSWPSTRSRCSAPFWRPAAPIRTSAAAFSPRCTQPSARLWTSPRSCFPSGPWWPVRALRGPTPRSPVTGIFKAPSIFYFSTFEQVFKAVESGMCQYGILPIENSTAGSVNAIYDLMTRHNFSIVAPPG